ncbi:hypothetical protein VTK26DRAFT_886 [Humicola hyalothermophila]
MAPLGSLLRLGSSLLVLAAAANAHFALVAPPPLEGGAMDESLQPNGPCGGGVADLSGDGPPTVDFHVGGDAVALALLHPQANWLIRGTLDPRADGNWTQLFPIVRQSGRGSFCEPVVAAPSEWAGQKGFIGIACNAPDGLLFQCAAVKFVSGTNTFPDGSACTNGSSVTIEEIDDDPALTALLTGETPTTEPGSDEDEPNAASSVLSGGLPIGSFVIAAVMFLVGAALV